MNEHAKFEDMAKALKVTIFKVGPTGAEVRDMRKERWEAFDRYRPGAEFWGIQFNGDTWYKYGFFSKAQAEWVLNNLLMPGHNRTVIGLVREMFVNHVPEFIAPERKGKPDA